jgi:hypothetical protein
LLDRALLVEASRRCARRIKPDIDKLYPGPHEYAACDVVAATCKLHRPAGKYSNTASKLNIRPRWVVGAGIDLGRSASGHQEVIAAQRQQPAE